MLLYVTIVVHEVKCTRLKDPLPQFSRPGIRCPAPLYMLYGVCLVCIVWFVEVRFLLFFCIASWPVRMLG